jgi:hypothetical protein
MEIGANSELQNGLEWQRNKQFKKIIYRILKEGQFNNSNLQSYSSNSPVLSSNSTLKK